MLPDSTQPTATQAGQIDNNARKFLNDLESIYADHRNQIPTRHHDNSPVPLIGTAPPVPQPGRPPMSQSAVDASTMMLSGGVASVLVGSAASLVMIASGHADPTVCGIVFGAPAVLTFALSRLMRRATEVASATPPDIHNHFNGTVHVDRRQTHSKTSGVIATTRNQTPR